MSEVTATDLQTEVDQLKSIVADLLAEARKQGAGSAEAGVSIDNGQSVTVRMGEIETVERTNDHSLGVTVYFGRKKGSANTTDLSAEAIRETVAAACRIARYTSEDEYTGLAEAGQMAKDYPDLDLYHPWSIEVEQAAGLALRCEDAARGQDPRITNSEGASVSTHNGGFVYGNSHGFVGGYPTTRHSVSCAVVAQEGDSMQRDYWYSSARIARELEDADAIGIKAAQRSTARLNGRKIGTRRVPVLFDAVVAPSLLRSLIGAVRGHALYRKASFLLDHLGRPIFPNWVRIREQPLLAQALGSAPFDNEGVATHARDLVSQGVLLGYVLDSYSARKLGMQTTGNAGGVHNLSIEAGPNEHDFPSLLREMDRGLLVTEMMGQGSNLVTGDYSRGAAGFWVEGGEIQYPVEEITVAGNLREMFRQLVAVGTDDRIPGSVRTGSWLIESMAVAGD